jgi:alpha-N-arabinofuranosidase
MFRQTIFYPYSWALQYASGNVLEVLVQSPTYQAEHMDPVPYIDSAATLNPANGQVSLFILNRDLSRARTVEVVWEDSAPRGVATSMVLTGDDLKAVNSFESPEKVKPQAFEKPSTSNNRTRFEVPARSFTLIQWS